MQRAPIRPKNAAPKKRGTLRIREYFETDGDGRPYHGYMVIGWTDAGGKRGRKKFRDESAAKAFLALKQVEALNSGSKLREVLTELTAQEVKEAEGAIRRLREVTNGQGTRVTLSDAVEAFLRSRAAWVMEAITVGEAAKMFIAERERSGVRARSLQQFEYTLNRLTAFLGGGATVGGVSPDDVRRFMTALRGKDGISPISAQTYNNYHAELHNFFAWAVAHELPPDAAGRPRVLCAENPLKKVRRKMVGGRGIPHILNVEQCRALLRAAEEEFEGGRFATYFALALFAGVRTGSELLKLGARSDIAKLIDLERGVIHILPEVSKTEDYRQTTIRPVLHAWLQRHGLSIPQKRSESLTLFRKRFGLKHDTLRHTFFSMHVAAFKSVGAAALEGGNSESVLRKHYLNLTSADEAHRFWEIMPTGGIA